MIRNKNQNSHRNFLVKKTGRTRKFVARLSVLLLILGAGFVVYHKLTTKTDNRAAATEVASTIPGWWYQQYFGASVCDKDNCKPDADPDQDKLTNTQEFYYHTNPLVAFTIKDTLNDGQLVALGFDPSRAGRMTFEQAGSDDNIIGESLVFNSDLKQLINESVDLTKVAVPQINDLELNISKDNSQQAAATYLASVKEVLNKNLSGSTGDKIEAAVKYNDDQSIAAITNSLIKSAAELKAISVPPDFVNLSKYSIGFLQTLPAVLNVPAPDTLLDDNNPIGNTWYDKTQATFSLYQKITLEISRLQTKYQNAK